MADLQAENIQINRSEPGGLMTLGDTTVWAVKYSYTTQGNSEDQYCILVMVDVFSGEIFRVYQCA